MYVKYACVVCVVLRVKYACVVCVTICFVGKCYFSLTRYVLWESVIFHLHGMFCG